MVEVALVVVFVVICVLALKVAAQLVVDVADVLDAVAKTTIGGSGCPLALVAKVTLLQTSQSFRVSIRLQDICSSVVVAWVLELVVV